MLRRMQEQTREMKEQTARQNREFYDSLNKSRGMMGLPPKENPDDKGKSEDQLAAEREQDKQWHEDHPESRSRNDLGKNGSNPTIGSGHNGLNLGQRIKAMPGKMLHGGINFGKQKLLNGADHALNGVTKGAAMAVDAAKTVFNKAKQVIGGLLHFIKAVFLPPGLFVTLGVTILIMAILAGITGFQTFGQSNIDCAAIDQQSKDIASNGGATSSDGAWTQEGTGAYNNAKNVWDYWVGKGFSGAAVAGIMGNVATESANTFDPKIVQGGSKSDDPSAAGGGGYGLYQFTPGSKYKNWAGYTGPSVTNESDAVWDMEVKNWSADYAKSSDVAAATKYWMVTYERPADQSDAAAQPRIQHAQKAYDLFGGSDVSYDQTKFSDSGSEATGGTDNSSDAKPDTTKCDVEKKNDAASGSTTGFKQCDQGQCSFDWMCDAIKVCHSGDAGAGIYPHLEYGYQCVWYAWNRLGMIHGKSGWQTVLGNGGDIWANLTGNSDWEVDLTPHAGDGISGHGQPLAATTHVAVVEKVEPDPSGWKIYISEGNDNGRADFNSYGTRWLTKTQALTGDNHFFRNKNWK
jgi:hypothetical protein